MVSSVQSPTIQNTVQYSQQPQYAQAVAYSSPAMNYNQVGQPKNITIQAPSPQYVCSPYSNNPYVCACSPTSNIVIPQGQAQMPSNQALGAPCVQAVIPQNPSKLQRSVNYNQVAPYINTNSTVMTPCVQTRSGHAIATASSVSQPLNNEEAQIVYQGPVKTINPQITPTEQSDNEIEKQFRNYFDNKNEFNKEMRKVLHNTVGLDEKKSTFLSKVAKVLGAIIIIGGLYKFRHKIPIIKRFCKK